VVDLVDAVKSLDIGVDQIHEHDVRLANRFRAGLGMPASDSAFVAVATPGAAERLAALS